MEKVRTKGADSRLFDFDALEVATPVRSPVAATPRGAVAAAKATQTVLRPRASAVAPKPLPSTDESTASPSRGSRSSSFAAFAAQRGAWPKPPPATAATGGYQWPTGLRRPEAEPAVAESAPRSTSTEGPMMANGLGGQRVLVRFPKAGIDGVWVEEEELKSIVEAIKVLFNGCTRHPPPMSEARPAFFTHHDPPRQVLYGGWFGNYRAPAALLEAPSENVAKYLREDPEGPFVKTLTEAGWNQWGFTRDRWQQSVLKADWHTLPTVGVEGEVFVPRKADVGLVRRAPPRFLAFVTAFRNVNKAVFMLIADVLLGIARARLRQTPPAAGSRLFECIATSLQKQRHFGILEAQVRWSKQGMRGQSHKDGATSLLHLGLTLGGERSLRLGAFPAATSPGNKQWNPWGDSPAPLPSSMDARERERVLGEQDVWDNDLWPPAYIRDITMVPGSAYLSSPFCLEHGVWYKPCEEEDKIIAIQCRFGFSAAVGKELNDERSDDMREVASVIAEVLRTATSSGALRMPTIGEIKMEDVRLREGV